MEQERLHYLKVSLLAYLVWIIVFEAVGFYAVTLPTKDVTLPLDRQIPLLSCFIWPYLLCYLFPFLPLVIVKDWHRFNKALLAIILANAAAFLVYILLPIAFSRPELGSGLSDRVLALQFRYDFKPGANKLPSLHVTYAWIVYLLCRKQGLGRLREGLIFLTAMLISVSTLFVKQHILLDVLAGAAWAFAAWFAAGRLYPRLAGPGTAPPEALKHLVWRAALPLLLYTALLVFFADLCYRRILP
ncbi:MAG: phosphatase PAP2 family protein [Candidatus Aminicenantales bacterium]